MKSISPVIPDKMPHQAEGVVFLRRAGGRALLADQMGLGKSRTTIEYLKEEKLRATIVTTKSFLYGWKAEVERWWPEAMVDVARPRAAELKASDVTLITYDVLRTFNVKLLNKGCVVFDESHKLMNASTKRSRAARALVRGKKQVICLTGTPMPNGQPQQLWHQMLLVGPTFLSWPEYRDAFCDPHQEWASYLGRYVWNYAGASNVPELKRLIETRFLRRTKELLRLPPLTDSFVPTPVKLARDSEEAWPTYAHRLAAATVPHTLSLVKDCLERGSKVIVFTSSKDVRDLVYASLGDGKVVMITAGTPPAVRSLQVQAFQEDAEVRTFVATTQIAAEGITLTAADVVVYNDLPWTPGLLEQSMARAHRKGQTRPVHVYKMRTDTRYDAIVRESLERKQAVTAELLEKKE